MSILLVRTFFDLPSVPVNSEWKLDQYIDDKQRHVFVYRAQRVEDNVAYESVAMYVLDPETQMTSPLRETEIPRKWDNRMYKEIPNGE